MSKRFEIFHNSQPKMVRLALDAPSSTAAAMYKEAVEALNGLQSNAAYLRLAADRPTVSNNHIQGTINYLERSGMSMEKLDALSVIHVAGTKGKGSTCAFLERILRGHGYKTGLYTSPHLVSVRERICINGRPLKEETFARYFWRLYDELKNNREHEQDMPAYFRFLTLLSFHIFAEEPVDVAIIEVGIGGERDSTNIIRKPRCVGITSLGFDHTKLLGNTLESIAYQKSGILKKNSLAFTVDQPEEAMTVIKRRALEKEVSSLDVVGRIEDRDWPSGEPPILGIPGDFQAQNASLALSLAEAWIKSADPKGKFSLEVAAQALSDCRWPGRMQIISLDKGDYYIDGAHTRESMEACASWFARSTEADDSAIGRFLVFNLTGDRDPVQLLDILRPLDFHRAFFVPNNAGKLATTDQTNRTVSRDEQTLRCLQYRDNWGAGGVFLPSFSDLVDCVEASPFDKVRILVTGSLHLVGAALTVLDPELTFTNSRRDISSHKQI